jgi:hypothetical protein
VDMLPNSFMTSLGSWLRRRAVTQNELVYNTMYKH